MAAQRGRERHQFSLERAVGLDRHRTAGDSIDICQIAAEQVKWMKTADRCGPVPNRREQFDGRRTAAMHDGPCACSPGAARAGKRSVFAVVPMLSSGTVKKSMSADSKAR